MALTRSGATEELTGLAPRSQLIATTAATTTRRAPTPPALTHARARRATLAMGLAAPTSTNAQVLPRPAPQSTF